MQSVFSYISVGSLIALMIVGFLFFKSCENVNRLKQEREQIKQKNRQNVQALKQKVEVTSTKNGQLEKQVAVYQGTIEELEVLSDSLAHEAKVEKGDVRYITKYEAIYNTKSFTIPNTVRSLNDSTYGLRWEQNRSSLFLRGETRFSLVDLDTAISINPMETTIDSLSFAIDLVTGLKKTDDGLYKTFARSSSSNVNVTSIESAILQPNQVPDEKDSRFGLGLHVGYGLYPIVNNNAIEFRHGPVISIGANFNLIRFNGSNKSLHSGEYLSIQPR